eukprot:SAG22_NODE_30_length_28348_cov_12.488584_3_plen_78_part_00
MFLCLSFFPCGPTEYSNRGPTDRPTNRPADRCPQLPNPHVDQYVDNLNKGVEQDAVLYKGLAADKLQSEKYIKSNNW